MQNAIVVALLVSSVQRRSLIPAYDFLIQLFTNPISILNFIPATLACATHVRNLQDIGHNPSPLEGGATHVDKGSEYIGRMPRFIQNHKYSSQVKAPNPSPLEGEGARRAGEGHSYSHKEEHEPKRRCA